MAAPQDRERRGGAHATQPRVVQGADGEGGRAAEEDAGGILIYSTVHVAFLFLKLYIRTGCNLLGGGQLQQLVCKLNCDLRKRKSFVIDAVAGV